MDVHGKVAATAITNRILEVLGEKQIAVLFIKLENPGLKLGLKAFIAF